MSDAHVRQKRALLLGRGGAAHVACMRFWVAALIRASLGDGDVSVVLSGKQQNGRAAVEAVCDRRVCLLVAIIWSFCC